MPQPPLRSFIDVAPDSDFPIQNLPYGVFSTARNAAPRVGVAIGELVLDLAVLEQRWLRTAVGERPVFREPSLNPFMACGPAAWAAVRERVTHLLRHDVADLRDDDELRALAFTPMRDVRMHLPCVIGDYTDFYAGIHHAMNVGRIFRGPDAALMPNYRWMPIGYHGRSSSVVVSGTPIRRPCGQIKPADAPAPTFGPTRELDFELEVGMLIGVGNPLGDRIPAERAGEHIFGLALVNDWSARDIQQWEYQPLGPFLGKNFGTTLSPWVVPMAALEPFRCAGPEQTPAALEYLRVAQPWSYDIQLEITLQPAGGAATTITRTNFRELYWSLSQMVAHHTVAGCPLRPGDLLATGTISGQAAGSFGSMLELAQRGRTPVALDGGGERVFLNDCDRVTIRGRAQADTHRIGFGECTGVVLPAQT